MKYLLDTYAFILLDKTPENLPQKVVDLFELSEANIYLSIASVWEMQIKTQLGKLDFPKPLPQIIDEQVSQNDLLMLPYPVKLFW